MHELDSGFQPVWRAVALADALRHAPELSRAQLARLLREHGESARDVGTERFSSDDAAALRAAVATVAEILVRTDVDDVAHALNALLAENASVPWLSNHDGHPWHLHVDRGQETGWAQWFLATSALGLAQLLSERGRIAWGECAADGCVALYLHSGPGSPRRYCSTECATRTRVAAHRARKRKDR